MCKGPSVEGCRVFPKNSKRPEGLPGYNGRKEEKRVGRWGRELIESGSQRI